MWIFLVALPLFFLFLVFQFDPLIRKFIFKRDGGKCQACGRRWGDGWMLHAAHYAHEHNSPRYNDPSNGRMLCIDCHMDEHYKLAREAERRGDKAGARKHRQAAAKLNLLDRRTWEWRKKH